MQHFFKHIQGWSSFLPWYREAVEKAPPVGARFVELGTWKGKSAAFMAVEIANSGKSIDFTTFDTFMGSDEPAHHADPVIQQGRLEQVARHNLRSVTKRGLVRVVKSDSVEAANDYGDGTVSFVFIDAGHTYENVSADISAWWPKLTANGVMAGDDYTWAGVRKAVLEAFGQEGIYHSWATDIECAFGANGEKCWRIRKWKSG